MPDPWPVPLYGHCACGALRYRLDRTPLYIHCCNCQACQRESGSAFALNAFVEADAVTIVPPVSSKKSDGDKQGDSTEAAPVQPKRVVLPTESGQGQMSVLCPHCFTSVWSHYAGAGPYVAFIKAGTLEKNGKDGKSLDDVLRPDINIYCKFKQPWVVHDKDTKSTEEFYDVGKTWPADALQRFGVVKQKTEGWKERGSKWEEIGDEVDDLIKRVKDL